MTPFVSVILPVRNEERYIKKCLESLVNQTYSNALFEVLIIDGLSEDRTLDIVKRFKTKLNLRILKNPKIKQVYAFNVAINQARGEFFLLVSGHSFVEPDFIEKSVVSFFRARKDEPKLAAVGGKIDKVYENVLARLVGLVYSSSFSGGSNFWYSRAPHFTDTVASGFYDKKFVESVGCFDEDMITGNDYELNLRLVREGYKLYYDPEIRFSYFTRSSFSRFLTQSFNYGAVKGICIRKGFFRSLWPVPTLFFLYQLILCFLACSNFGLFTVLSIPFLLSWGLNLSASALLAKKDVYGLLLPIMYWMFHNVIGLGFLKGILLGRDTFK